MNTILLSGTNYIDLHYKIDLFVFGAYEIISLNVTQDKDTSMYYATIIYKEKPKRKAVKKDE